MNEVKNILNRRKSGRKFEYLVEWENASKEEAWIPLNNLDCNDKIAEFEDSLTPKYTPTKIIPSLGLPLRIVNVFRSENNKLLYRCEFLGSCKCANISEEIARQYCTDLIIDFLLKAAFWEITKIPCSILNPNNGIISELITNDKSIRSHMGVTTDQHISTDNSMSSDTSIFTGTDITSDIDINLNDGMFNDDNDVTSKESSKGISENCRFRDYDSIDDSDASLNNDLSSGTDKSYHRTPDLDINLDNGIFNDNDDTYLSLHRSPATDINVDDEMFNDSYDVTTKESREGIIENCRVLDHEITSDTDTSLDNDITNDSELSLHNGQWSESDTSIESDMSYDNFIVPDNSINTTHNIIPFSDY